MKGECAWLCAKSYGANVGCCVFLALYGLELVALAVILCELRQTLKAPLKSVSSQAKSPTNQYQPKLPRSMLIYFTLFVSWELLRIGSLTQVFFVTTGTTHVCLAAVLQDTPSVLMCATVITSQDYMLYLTLLLAQEHAIAARYRQLYMWVLTGCLLLFTGTSFVSQCNREA